MDIRHEVDWSRKLNRAGSSYETTKATKGAGATEAYEQKEEESLQSEEEQKVQQGEETQKSFLILLAKVVPRYQAKSKEAPVQRLRRVPMLRPIAAATNAIPGKGRGMNFLLLVNLKNEFGAE